MQQHCGPVALRRQSEIICVGTGTSDGNPRLSCLTNPVDQDLLCMDNI